MIRPWIGFVSLLLATKLMAFTPPEIEKKIYRHMQTNTWPNLYYDVVPKIISLHDYKIIVEVGVGLGGHAESILRSTDNTTYFGIDPYVYVPGDAFLEDVAKYTKDKQQSFEYLYNWVNHDRLSSFQGRYRIIRKPSLIASKLFADKSIDCLFIDGDHRYSCVLDDLIAWYPKLKNDGMILGTDYFRKDVARAVSEFAKMVDLPLLLLKANSGYQIWAIKKTPVNH